MKMRSFVTVAALAMVVATGGMAQPPGHGGGCPKGGHGPGGGPHRMWKALGLTEEQKEKLKSLRDDSRSDQKEHHDKLKALREKMREELGKKQPSRSVLDGLVAEQGELHKAMIDKKITHLLAVKEILTAEQFEKLLEKHWIEGPSGCGADCPKKGTDDCPKHTTGARGMHGCPMGKGGGGPSEG